MPGFFERMEAMGGPVAFHKPIIADVYDFLSAQVQENHRAGGGSKPLGKREVNATISRSEAAQSTLLAVEKHVQTHTDFEYLGVKSASTFRELNAKKALPDNVFSAEDVGKLEIRAENLATRRDSAWDEVIATGNALPDGLTEGHDRPGLPVEGEY